MFFVAIFNFRVNTDWLWENFPNERRFASMIFTAENILQPEVIQTIYKVRKSVEELVTAGRFAFLVYFHYNESYLSLEKNCFILVIFL